MTSKRMMVSYEYEVWVPERYSNDWYVLLDQMVGDGCYDDTETGNVDELRERMEPQVLEAEMAHYMVSESHVGNQTESVTLIDANEWEG